MDLKKNIFYIDICWIWHSFRFETEVAICNANALIIVKTIQTFLPLPYTHIFSFCHRSLESSVQSKLERETMYQGKHGR